MENDPRLFKQPPYMSWSPELRSVIKLQYQSGRLIKDIAAMNRLRPIDVGQFLRSEGVDTYERNRIVATDPTPEEIQERALLIRIKNLLSGNV